MLNPNFIERSITRRRLLQRGTIGVCGLAGGAFSGKLVCADEKPEVDFSILSSARWKEIEETVDRGLEWMAGQQKPTGGYSYSDLGEPGISGLCLLAYLSRGHLPGEGKYRSVLSKCLEYILGCQSRNGMLSKGMNSQAANYNHGIGSLALSETYSLVNPSDSERLKKTIERCVEFAAQRLSVPKNHRDDEGGWRYLRRHAESDSDLSITSWHLMFLRSARNAGFEIDGKLIEEGLEYVKRVFDERRGTFRYEIHTDDPGYNHTRAMAGAGILSLAMTGEHHSKLARIAADNLLKTPFMQYDHPVSGEKHQCYSAFYCSQAMFHMGGDYWKKFYPQLSSTLIKSQKSDGSWRPVSGDDARYGLPYIAALTILALTAPFQLLPIFQR